MLAAEARLHTLQCSNGTNATSRKSVTSQEVGRAEYCGYDLGMGDAQDDSTLPSRNVTCEDGETHELRCSNTTGSISFTCPAEYTTGDCSWWNEAAEVWSDEGCTWWYVGWGVEKWGGAGPHHQPTTADVCHGPRPAP